MTRIPLRWLPCIGLFAVWPLPSLADLAAPPDGGWESTYQAYLADCPAQAAPDCGGLDRVIFYDVKQSSVADKASAEVIARRYVASHPWPGIKDGYSLSLRLERTDHFYWHGLIQTKAPGTAPSRPLGHVWVLLDGSALYPVGYK